MMTVCHYHLLAIAPVSRLGQKGFFSPKLNVTHQPNFEKAHLHAMNELSQCIEECFDVFAVRREASRQPA